MLAAALTALLGLAACVHPRHPPAPSKHPHGMPPGQAKKMYQCGHCGATNPAAVNCHGKVMILIP
jgi:hypothetical protein